MKEIYDWVPWFRELAGRIASEGEAYLNEKAMQVNWGENLARLEYGEEGIDPFSFLYFLASKAATKQLETVYESVSHEFAVRSPLPDPSVDENYIFPTPPALNALFRDGENFHNDLLWRLFRQAVPVHPEIEPNDFKDVLDIKGVGVPKLTQALFLINPGYFQSVDDTINDLSEALGLPALPDIQSEIKEGGGYENYQSLLEELRDAFPGCQPYEVNMFSYLQNSGDIQISDRLYQISTYVFDPGGGDYWDDFKKNNWVYTGGPGSGKSWQEEGSYPLIEPARGDTILVRTGRQRGRAIGIVQKNDYAESGLNETSRIHVFWINKSDAQLSGLTAMVGFSRSGDGTNRAFRGAESYNRSFGLMETLREGSTVIEPEPNPDSLRSVEPVTKNPNPLNQILYGPPGTSKTWHTINHALAIIDNKPVDLLELETKEDRKDKMRRFSELKKSGQIEMVTFHQNYNYEDFIEGIRPVLSDHMDEEGKLEYELSRGIFRGISQRALDNKWRSGQAAEEFWDIDNLLEAFAEWIDERLDSDEQIDLNLIDRKEGTKKIIEVIWSGDDTFKSVLAGTEENYRYLTRNVIKMHYKAFCDGEVRSKEDIKPTRNSKKPLHANARYYFALFEKIREFQENEWQPNAAAQVRKQNYVLIIDEINRGNIAKIFGELITLIEESKRIGGDDEATVTLPYSKDEDFGVPDNLYIIGTMNTADRSIALLDTALRRRFEFVEMMPDPTLVPDDIEGVNCQELLKVMNERIRFLLDREHQIGHTYLMNVKSIDSLALTFKNKIVPLLQEYFYDNWEKIELVLNRNGFIDKRDIPEELRAEDQLIDVEKKVYEVLADDDDRWHEAESYQAIYSAKPSPRKDTAETEPGS
ncbi:MAG: AAA family ATPase [Gemmatimonadota bacterium]|nr:AAA family ATPase [Gemmatimonadota bacterium]